MTRWVHGLRQLLGGPSLRALGLAGCVAGCNATTERDDCPGQVEVLLSQVGVEAPSRVDCGNFNSAESQAIADAMECFDAAVEAGDAVELTVNRCIDCSIPSAYIATATGELYEVATEADQFGDELRHASVFACASIELDAANPFAGPSCEQAEELFTCEAPLRE